MHNLKISEEAYQMLRREKRNTGKKMTTLIDERLMKKVILAKNIFTDEEDTINFKLPEKIKINGKTHHLNDGWYSATYTTKDGDERRATKTEGSRIHQSNVLVLLVMNGWL